MTRCTLKISLLKQQLFCACVGSYIQSRNTGTIVGALSKWFQRNSSSIYRTLHTQFTLEELWIQIINKQVQLHISTTQNGVSGSCNTMAWRSDELTIWACNNMYWCQWTIFKQVSKADSARITSLVADCLYTKWAWRGLLRVSLFKLTMCDTWNVCNCSEKLQLIFFWVPPVEGGSGIASLWAWSSDVVVAPPVHACYGRPTWHSVKPCCHDEV